MKKSKCVVQSCRLVVFLFCVLRSLSAVADRVLTDQDMLLLCAGDYIDFENKPVPVEGFEPLFLAQMFSLCDQWSSSSAIKLPSRADLDNSVCDSLLQGEQSRTWYDEYYSWKSEGLPIQERTLCYFATSDSDSDGITDFAVDECGYFTDHDSDADNDGVRNWFDQQHLVGGESNCILSENIPPLLDWHVSRVPGGQAKSHNTKLCNSDDLALCGFQRNLWNQHDILIYERRMKFPLQLAQTLSDVLEHIFPPPELKEKECEHQTYSSMPRSVSVAKYPVREKEQNNCGLNGSIHAEANASTQDLVVYTGNWAPVTPLKSLAIMVHEIGHFYQYHQDFNSPENFHLFAVKGIWNTPNFDKRVMDLGWEFSKLPSEIVENAAASYTGATNAADDLTNHDADTYTLEKHALGKLQGYVDEIVKIFGVYAPGSNLPERYNEVYVKSVVDALRLTSTVGEYSLTDPWEWHSENLAAYVLSSIERHFLDRLLASDDLAKASAYKAIVDKVAQQMYLRVLADWDGAFNYRLISDRAFDSFSRNDQMPLEDESLDYLVCEYVVNNLTNIFYTEDYPYSVESFATQNDLWLDGTEESALKALVADYWSEICAQF